MCSIFMAPAVCGFSPWCNTFVIIEIKKKGSWFVDPSVSSSYSFALKFHQLCLAICIIGKWNKLHNTIVLEVNLFSNISYGIEIFHQKEKKSMFLHK